MLVKDAMKKKVIFSSPEESVRDAIRTIVDNRIGCVVIKKNERIIGIVTDRDILFEIEKNGIDINNTPLKDIMTHYVIYINPEASVEKAVKTMITNNIKKLPVIKNEKLVGIITTTDIVISEPQRTEELKKLLLKKSKKFYL